MVPVLCPIDGCVKVYYWDEELATKLPKDTTPGLPDSFEYWSDHYGQFNLVDNPMQCKSFKGIHTAIKNH
eukprot:7942884-Ditylum_brightwellii.AAC.1